MKKKTINWFDTIGCTKGFTVQLNSHAHPIGRNVHERQKGN